MPAALLLSRFPPAFCDALAERLELIGPHDQDASIALPADVRSEIRVVITMGTIKCGAGLIDALPNLGLICNYGSGFEGTDHAAAAKRGIVVTNSPSGNASAVADLAMGLLLAACRNILVADRFVRDGRWNGQGTSAARMPLVHGLSGRKLGIFGLGEIGERIARRAEAFEMTVAYHNRSRRGDDRYPYHETLQSLAEWADVLVVAARADAGNRHIVSRDVMRALGPDGIVINIARGSLLDEMALAELLRDRELGAAGLDVFEHEPNVPAALTALDNIVLAPHIAGGTFDAHATLKSMVLANVDAFLAGRPIPTPVVLKAAAATATG
ncbi:Lactate dehydrogenase [Kaistia soli DSM 19436]|uniref:Lactate dehydrogenase n=1 Tax=Kaistia soli DSM 19436 TaxID=1122133 RepID=A0A1M5K0P8_9HYPH|nr:2-hydroxyacid dehydrogenase [Kaistia soli]SHG46265.1 Lactate dehydrogenase [Kaistia soli DSM 19436]